MERLCLECNKQLANAKELLFHCLTMHPSDVYARCPEEGCTSVRPIGDLVMHLRNRHEWNAAEARELIGNAVLVDRPEEVPDTLNQAASSAPHGQAEGTAMTPPSGATTTQARSEGEPPSTPDPSPEMESTMASTFTCSKGCGKTFTKVGKWKEKHEAGCSGTAKARPAAAPKAAPKDPPAAKAAPSDRGAGSSDQAAAPVAQVNGFEPPVVKLTLEQIIGLAQQDTIQVDVTGREVFVSFSI